ncbi:MAG: hypothetical protein ABIE84_03305 [bacterium]
MLLVTCFLLLVTSSALAQTYPQIDISGFKKWEYKKADINPQVNYFQGLTHLGGYYPTFTGGPWQERLQLRILGQLSEDLSVTYDLEQQPETPERYDVKVTYEPKGNTNATGSGIGLGLGSFTELTFGDFQANYSGNEFASASKSLNGVKLETKDSWFDMLLVPSAKLKSQTQKLTTQNGNNTKGPYSLGHGSITENTERIELNNVLLKRNVDYTIDYFEGKVNFNQILTQDDTFKYSYEYTNILDIFFPTLSKRDFFGFQSRVKINPEEFGRAESRQEPAILADRIIFPAATTDEAEITEGEEMGRFLLPHPPVVKFSERINFMGTVLRKDEDYIIRYQSGEIKLLTRFLPSEEELMVVEYQYFGSSTESESIVGIDSRGPYELTNQYLIEESERIEVDGRLYVRDLDYTIDYNAGELIFSQQISKTSQIKADYQHKIMQQATQSASKFPKELTFGTTYLKESAKKGESTAVATVIETIRSSDIINNSNHIYLLNRPFLPTTEAGSQLTVTIDGVGLTPEVDYTVPATALDAATGLVTVTPEASLAYINDHADPTDGYGTGTILLYDHITVTSTSQVTVTYTYKKSVVNKYSGTGDGTRGPYYLRNVRNVIPGSETVQVWEQGSSIITTYTRNSSFEADGGATGYAINYDENNPTITFNDELTTTKNFQIIYQYVPPTAFEGGDISQSVYGIDASYKVGDIFTIDTAYAKSETDQVYIAESTIESFSGSGIKTYALHSSKAIIEGTEKIYVNNNLLNRDIDYYVSYTQPGSLTFYYITPTSLDAISVEYQIQSNAGIALGQDVKAGAAYRLGAETKLFGDKLVLGGKTKQIDRNFTPMGGTAIGLGSKYNEYSLAFVPGWHDLNTSYSYKENNNPIGTSRTRFLRAYDNSFSLGLNPRGVSQINLTYRNYKAADDLGSGITTHSSDTEQNSYTLNIVPGIIQRGIFSLSQKYDLQRSISDTDTERDSGTYSQTNTSNDHANLSLKLTDRITIGYDHQASEPKTKSLRTSSAEAEEDSSHRQATDNSYTFSLDLTPTFWQKLTTRISLLNHEEKTLIKDFSSTLEVLSTKNETYHVDLIPIQMINLSADRTRQERSTVIIGGINPKTERTSARAKVTPLSWLAAGWNGSQSEVIPETGLNYKTTGRSNAYDIDYNPISLQKVKLTTKFTLSDNNQTAPVGTSDEVQTITNTLAQRYNLNLTFIPRIPIDLGLVLEDYQNNNTHPIPSSQIDTKTQNKTITVSSNFSPLPPLTLSANYNQKTIKVEKDLNVSLVGQEKTKTVLDGKAAYQIASWGTVVYNQVREDNGGEIQAGAVTPLDILKVTESYSLNITLPVDNPVLSNFVFTASIKSVDFKNRSNSGDDFKASLATFEGMLNF